MDEWEYNHTIVMSRIVQRQGPVQDCRTTAVMEEGRQKLCYLVEQGSSIITTAICMLPDCKRYINTQNCTTVNSP